MYEKVKKVYKGNEINKWKEKNYRSKQTLEEKKLNSELPKKLKPKL